MTVAMAVSVQMQVRERVRVQVRVYVQIFWHVFYRARTHTHTAQRSPPHIPCWGRGSSHIRAKIENARACDSETCVRVIRKHACVQFRNMLASGSETCLRVIQKHTPSGLGECVHNLSRTTESGNERWTSREGFEGSLPTGTKWLSEEWCLDDQYVHTHTHPRILCWNCWCSALLNSTFTHTRTRTLGYCWHCWTSALSKVSARTHAHTHTRTHMRTHAPRILCVHTVVVWLIFFAASSRCVTGYPCCYCGVKHLGVQII
jgi:hypothetical protein